MQAYETLAALFGRLRALNDAAGILGWDAQTLMPAGAAEGRAEQLATLRGMAHELLVAPAVADPPRPSRPSVRQRRRPRSLGGGQPARDEARPRPRRRRARRPRRGGIQGYVGGRDGLARGPRHERLRDSAPAPRGGAVGGARHRAGQGRGARPRALRRVARSVRSRPARKLHRSLVRPPPRRAARPPRRCPRDPGRKRRTGAARRPLPRRRAARAGRAPHARHRVRLRARSARRQPAPVLRRRHVGRAHHHALPRGRFQPRPDGRAARDRARHVRAGPPARLAGPARGRRPRHGYAREPVAAGRDAGLPHARVPRLPGAAGARGLRARHNPTPAPCCSCTPASSPASSASTPTR